MGTRTFPSTVIWFAQWASGEDCPEPVSVTNRNEARQTRSVAGWPVDGTLRCVLTATALAVWTSSCLYAQAPTTSSGDVVVAVVGQERVYRRDVDRMLRRVLAGRRVDSRLRPWVEAQVLDEIVSRHLVLAHARRTGLSPGRRETEAAMRQLQQRIAARGRSVQEYLAEQSMTEADLRRRVTWELVWKRIARRYVTDQRVEAYFDAHRRQLDGTQLFVRHILLEMDAAPERQRAERLEQARAIRRAILSGQLSFEEAARRYSTAPSAAEGGRVGWIGYDGPMVEAFSRAAFALEVGEVSGPVVTPFGVHLIRVDRIRPGDRPLAEVRDEVEQRLQRELLERLARQERQFTPVRYTGASPYLDLDTGQLVLPDEPSQPADTTP